MSRPSSLADLATIFDSQPISGMRNRIINGDQRVDQRNAGGSTTVSSGAVAYTTDRNGVYNAGPNVITVQRIAGSAGFQHALRITGSASNAGVSWYQRNEASNVFDLASTQVTFSAWVWASSSRNVTPSVTTPNSFEGFGSQTGGGSTTWAVTTTPTRFSWVFTMPANAVNGAEMAIALGTLLAGETVTITGIQLEAGPFATPFERRSFGQELMLCQRYYQKTFNQATAPAQNAGGVGALSAPGSATNTSFNASWWLACPMRANPTVVTFSPDNASANWSDQAGSRPTATVITIGQASVGIRGEFSVLAGGYYTIHATASAEL